MRSPCPSHRSPRVPFAIAFSAIACIAGSRSTPAQAYPLGQLNGAGSGETFGWSIALPGDVDGDGHGDILVGIPGATVGTNPNAGIARAYSGRTRGVIHQFFGTACCGYLGTAVAGVGDVDLDGVPDLAVAAPELANGGEVRVISGRTGATLHTLVATSTQDQFGFSVCGVGDWNADGRADIAVGAPSDDPGGLWSAGRVTVFSGASGAILRTFDGLLGYDELGTSVAGVGDVNGDGVPDLAAGAVQPGFMQFFPVGPGFVLVYSGANGAVLHVLLGASNGERFGAAIAGPGDVDGDGFADVLVGAPGVVGAAHLYSGATGNALRSFAGDPSSFDHLGSAVARAGDLNGDDVPDYAISAPGWGNGGILRVHSGLDGSVLLSASSANLGDNLGFALAAGSDLDRDGAPDVIASAPFADPGGQSVAGEVRAYSFLGVPSGSARFGAGCAGSSGLAPIVSTSGGAATSAGNARFALHLTRAQSMSTSLLLAGISNTTWSGVALPLDLSSLGRPGCALLVSLELVQPLPTNAAGRAVLPAAIPRDPTLAGRSAYIQGYVVDPGPAPIPGAMTGGLALLLL